MPVRVSYKKQFAVMTMLLLTFLIVIELGVNVWLYSIYRCDFEEREVFKNFDEETKRKMCLENIGLDFTKQSISATQGTGHNAIGGINEAIVSINNQDLRGEEYSIKKPDKTFRIFVIGGSTIFGSGVLDNQTVPYYLQQEFDKEDFVINVEVINGGWIGWWSYKETQLIKDKLMLQKPDLFIVYDGWNELNQQVKGQSKATPTLWMERWKEICELGKSNGFETIVTLQPWLYYGEKLLTEQEQQILKNQKWEKMAEPYPLYIQQLDGLKNYCAGTYDLRNIFDNFQGPIYYDVVHVGPEGNKITAKKFYQISLPIIFEKLERNEFNDNLDSVVLKDKSIKLATNEFDKFLEDSSNTLRKIIFPYKTPRILSLIFQQ